MVQRKSIETIGSLGLDGLHELIHQLYQDEENPNYPEFLEKHILTFGVRILSYISKEIESESKNQRKVRLQELYEHTLDHYNLRSADDFTIML